MTGTFDPYASRPGKGDGVPEADRDSMRLVVATVRDKPSVAQLLDWLTEEDRPPWDEVYLVGGHVRWVRPATDEERAAWAVWKAEADARTVEWEKATLARLLEKYGDPR